MGEQQQTGTWQLELEKSSGPRGLVIAVPSPTRNAQVSSGKSWNSLFLFNPVSILFST